MPFPVCVMHIYLHQCTNGLSTVVLPVTHAQAEEMLFNVEPEMRQLTHVSPLPSGGREGGGGGLEDVQGLVGVHAVEGVPEGSAVEGSVSQ